MECVIVGDVEEGRVRFKVADKLQEVSDNVSTSRLTLAESCRASALLRKRRSSVENEGTGTDSP